MVKCRGYSRALELATEREHARRDGDYERGDAIRRDLEAMGVRLDDTRHFFTTVDGHRGSYSLKHGVGFEEVQLMCLDREEARRENLYEESDHIRNQLSEMGVKIDDRAHLFTMPDGMKGSYDLHYFEREVPRTRRYDDPGYSEPHGGHVNGRDRPAERPAPGYHDRPPPPPGYHDRPPPEYHDRPPPPGYHDRPPPGYHDRHDRPPPPPPGYHDRPPPDYHDRRPPDYHDRRPPDYHDRRPPDYHDRPPPGYHDRSPPRAFQERKAPPRRPPAHEEEDFDRARQRPLPPPPPPPPPPAHSEGGVGDRFEGYLDTLKRALEREELRKARDYEGSDRLRVILSQQGAVLNDNTHIFSHNGWEGTYDLNIGVTFREVQFVALEREEARRDRDYARGDALRQWLADNHVQLDDKTHLFTMDDGTAGSYDLYHWTPTPIRRGEPHYKRQRRD